MISEHVPLGGDMRADPVHTGVIVFCLFVCLGAPWCFPGGAGAGLCGWDETCMGFSPGPEASATQQQINGRKW